MSKQHKNASQRGKSFEKSFTKFLVDNGIPAKRVERISNFSISDTDVKIDNLPNLKIDCKSRATFASATLFEEDVIQRYCKEKSDRAVMPMKVKGMRGCYIMIQDSLFVEMLKSYIKDKSNAL